MIHTWYDYICVWISRQIIICTGKKHKKSVIVINFGEGATEKGNFYFSLCPSVWFFKCFTVSTYTLKKGCKQNGGRSYAWIQ